MDIRRIFTERIYNFRARKLHFKAPFRARVRKPVEVLIACAIEPPFCRAGVYLNTLIRMLVISESVNSL